MGANRCPVRVKWKPDQRNRRLFGRYRRSSWPDSRHSKRSALQSSQNRSKSLDVTDTPPPSPSPPSPHSPVAQPSSLQYPPPPTTPPNSHTHKSSEHDSPSGRPYPPSARNCCVHPAPASATSPSTVRDDATYASSASSLPRPATAGHRKTSYPPPTTPRLFPAMPPAVSRCPPHTAS